jgi:murein DD-endopeptidase MepM/ murein hydrolase activator NlpD
MKKILLILFIFLFIVVAGLSIYFSLTTEVTNNLDTYIYDLPFKEGTSPKVVQAYGGMFSHRHKRALDFSMAKGTPVYAAREGVIYSFKNDSDEGGPFPWY